MATKLTQDVHSLIVTLVRNGNYLETAAAAAGVAEPTVRRWMHEGATTGEEPYHSFWEDVIKAEAAKEDELLGRVEQAGRSPEFWQANAWILARRHPKRWQEKVQIEVQAEMSRILTHLEERLAPELYTIVLEALSENSNRPVRRVSEVTNSGPRALPTRGSTSE